MAYKCFDKRSAPVHSNNSAGHKGTGINSENEQLEEQLHRPIIRKQKGYSLFKSKIWGADLADM